MFDVMYYISTAQNLKHQRMFHYNKLYAINVGKVVINQWHVLLIQNTILDSRYSYATLKRVCGALKTLLWYFEEGGLVL